MLERRAVSGRRGGHRGIPSRLPQFDRELHGEPAQSEGHPRSEARRARARDRRAAVRQFPAAAGRRLSQGRRRPRGDAGRGRALLAPRRATRCPRTTRCSIASPTCCASCCSRRRPTSAAASRCAARCAGRSAKRFRALDLAGAARRARPLHQERGRRARPLVRIRADQGGVRLRRRRRQLREPVHAGLRVRAAASRVRRGQRQARPVGPRDRRHGRDHAGDGERMRGARRRRCAPNAPVARVIVKAGRAVGRRARGRRGDRGARASSPTSIRSCCSCELVDARASATRISARASPAIAAARARSA